MGMLPKLKLNGGVLGLLLIRILWKENMANAEYKEF
jgi:hypothetical protein